MKPRSIDALDKEAPFTTGETLLLRLVIKAIAAWDWIRNLNRKGA